MSPQAQIAAEKRHAQNVGVQGTISIEGTRYPVRIFTERGAIYQEQGGKVQNRKISAIILCSLLPSSRLVDADGNTRPLVITHVETSTDYRIDTGGIDRSPHGIYWILEASQSTAR